MLSTNDNKMQKLNNAGFSLVEVVIAMAILALVSIPLMRYFSDSMRYTVAMAQEQRATTLAQQVVEDIESVDDLLDEIPTPVLGGPIYQDNYLLSKGYTLDSSTYDPTTKISQLVYRNEGGYANFDVRVTVSTDTPANARRRALIYGIDDRCDILIVEKEQTTEAIAYFLAANTSELSNHHSAVAVSQDDIRAALYREMNIDISYDSTSSKYHIDAYYTYTCSAVTSAGTYTTASILSKDMTSLSKIYFLYEQISGHNSDMLKINCDTAARTQMLVNGEPELDIVCQNPVSNSSYALYVKRISLTEFVRSNIRSVYGDLYDNGPGGTSIHPEELTSSATDVLRVLSIKLEIFKTGEIDSGSPIVVTNTTKGE